LYDPTQLRGTRIALSCKVPSPEKVKLMLLAIYCLHGFALRAEQTSLGSSLFYFVFIQCPVNPQSHTWRPRRLHISKINAMLSIFPQAGHSGLACSGFPWGFEHWFSPYCRIFILLVWYCIKLALRFSNPLEPCSREHDNVMRQGR
jgi:hypothetical protein